MSIHPFDESGSSFVSVNGEERCGLWPASADCSGGRWADSVRRTAHRYRDFIDDWPHLRPKDLLERLEGAGLSIRKP